jgi:hypothetical protein
MRTSIWHFVAISATLCATPMALAQDETAPAPTGAETAMQPATQPTETPATTADASSKPEWHGLFGAFRVGPSISLDVPHLVTTSLDATYNRTFGFSIAASNFYRKFDADEVKQAEVELKSFDVRFRWFPWQGSFFIGASYGKQAIGVKGKKDLALNFQGNSLTVPTHLKYTLDTTYFTPHLGWFATWDSGFTMGFEVGAQIPTSTKAELKVAFDNVGTAAENEVKESSQYKDAKKDVEDAGEALGKKVLPYINLIRIGWLF